MQCYSDFIFFSAISEPAISNILANRNAGRTLVIEVTGASTGLQLDIEGSIDLATNVFSVLAVKNAMTGVVASRITGAGIYIVDAIGISSLRATVAQITTGTPKVFGKLMSY